MAQQASMRFFLPAAGLRQAISAYGALRVFEDQPVEDMVHPEWPHIRLPLSGDWSVTLPGGGVVNTQAPAAVVSGTLSRAMVARGGPGLLVGVGLLPAGWARLTAMPAAQAADAVLPLAQLVGAPAADALLAALLPLDQDEALCAELDRWFLAQFADKPPVDALLVAAHQALLDPDLASVADWARRLGRSTRQLERMTLDYFGMSPKALLRRQRFLRTFASIREQPRGAWGRLLDERYGDQPQFVREFNYFMGMAPSAYFARPFPFMVAAGDARQALLGAPVQGLHPSA